MKANPESIDNDKAVRRIRREAINHIPSGDKSTQSADIIKAIHLAETLED